MYLIIYVSGHTDVVNILPAPYNGCLLVGGLIRPTWAKYVPLLVFEARKLLSPAIRKL